MLQKLLLQVNELVEREMILIFKNKNRERFIIDLNRKELISFICKSIEKSRYLVKHFVLLKLPPKTGLRLEKTFRRTYAILHSVAFLSLQMLYLSIGLLKGPRSRWSACFTNWDNFYSFMVLLLNFYSFILCTNRHLEYVSLNLFEYKFLIYRGYNPIKLWLIPK